MITSYYAGIYNDDRGKVLQVSDDIDCLSCEILAKPGVCHGQPMSTAHMIHVAKISASFFRCHHLEINCSRGRGSYQWIPIKGTESYKRIDQLQHESEISRWLDNKESEAPA